MILSAEDIKLILNLLAEKTVVEPSDVFPYRVSARSFGYSDDPKIGPLQAKLSIMLQVASARESK